MAIKTEKNAFTKDLAMLVDVMRGLIYRGFGMKQPLVFDPFMDDTKAKNLGVKKVTLQELMQLSDFITIHCPLNEHTRNLISLDELNLMKSTSFIINTARGGIINEDALFEVL